MAIHPIIHGQRLREARGFAVPLSILDAERLSPEHGDAMLISDLRADLGRRDEQVEALQLVIAEQRIQLDEMRDDMRRGSVAVRRYWTSVDGALTQGELARTMESLIRAGLQDVRCLPFKDDNGRFAGLKLCVRGVPGLPQSAA